MSELLPPDEIARIEAESPALPVAPREKVHTGVSLDRAQRDILLRKFAAGKSRREIARDMGVSRNTVAAVIHQAEQEGAIENWRGRMARRLEGILEDHLVGLEENPPEMSSVDFGILTDKWEKLAGQAQVKIEVSIRREDPKAMLDELAALSRGIIDVDATPLPPASQEGSTP